MLKKMKLIALLTLIMSILIGCQAKKEEAKKESKESTEITLMIPDWGAPTEEMLAEFKAETGISVKVLPTAWDDTKNKISIAAAGKKAVADVVEVDWSWVGEFQSAGWLEPLEVDDATQKDIPSISYFKVKDKIYAVPYANGLRLAYINDEMLSKAGIKRVNEAWNGIDGIEETFDKLKKSKVVSLTALYNRGEVDTPVRIRIS